jgi:hypothetical protein
MFSLHAGLWPPHGQLTAEAPTLPRLGPHVRATFALQKMMRIGRIGPIQISAAIPFSLNHLLFKLQVAMKQLRLLTLIRSSSFGVSLRPRYTHHLLNCFGPMRIEDQRNVNVLVALFIFVGGGPASTTWIKSDRFEPKGGPLSVDVKEVKACFDTRPARHLIEADVDPNYIGTGSADIMKNCFGNLDWKRSKSHEP